MSSRSNYVGKSYAGGARVEQLDLVREIALWESWIKLIAVKATGTLSSYEPWLMATNGAYFAKCTWEVIPWVLDIALLRSFEFSWGIHTGVSIPLKARMAKTAKVTNNLDCLRICNCLHVFILRALVCFFWYAHFISVQYLLKRPGLSTWMLQCAGRPAMSKEWKSPPVKV